MKNRAWVNITILLVCLASVWGIHFFLSHAPPIVVQTVPQVQKVPAFTFQDMAGKVYQLYNFAGKKVILNFWASWCAPCIAEFPILLDFAANNPDIVLISLSIEDNPNDVKKFVRRFSSRKLKNWIVGMDGGQKISRDLFQTFQVPETILIDENQRQIRKWVGAISEKETYFHAKQIID